MLILTGAILSLFFYTTPMNASSISSNTSLFQNSTIYIDAAPDNVVCTGLQDGRLSPLSCVSALSKINTFTSPLIFRPRPPSLSDAIFLPLRYLSDDGRCAIDLSLKDGYRGDVGNGVGIYHAAQSVLQKCARIQKAGFATNFTPDNALIVSIRSYTPSVTCQPHLSTSSEMYIRACRNAAQQMPSSSQTRVYYNPPLYNFRGLELPRKYLSPSGSTGRCTIEVSMDNGQPPTRVSYRDLWHAAVGVVEMCAKDDKGGRAIGLGDNQKIMVSISM